MDKAYPIQIDDQGNLLVVAPRGTHAELARAFFGQHGASMHGDESRDLIRVDPTRGWGPVYFLADDEEEPSDATA